VNFCLNRRYCGVQRSRLKAHFSNFLARPWRRLSTLALLILCTAGASADGSKSAFSANEVEAVFLVNFCRFTNWPAETFTSSKQPIIIAVWGDDEFATLVERAAKGEHVGMHPVSVKRIQNASEAESVQILYVGESAELSFERTYDPEGKHVLLVGESRHFLSVGGHLQFMPAGKIRLRVNLSALKRSGLELNSNLLRICQTQ